VIELRRFRSVTLGRGAKETRVDAVGDKGVDGLVGIDSWEDDDEAETLSVARWRMPPEDWVGGAGQNRVFAAVLLAHPIITIIELTWRVRGQRRWLKVLEDGRHG
jgi:hypothetical protein